MSVSELTANLRELLETTFPEIWVEGELSNAKVWTTGHLYFTLKDGSAQIKGVMFRSALRYLKFKPEDGLHVVVRGRISVYDPKGEYQLVGEHMEPHGFGALQLAFEQLKKKLAAEGLFDASRKRPLPSLPRRIGIVTSIDGAALRDIVRVLRRRYPNAHLVIAPSRVQGEDAAGEIVRALRQIGAHRRRRCRHPRARRRFARRSLGVQRGKGRARDRRVSGAGHLGGRPRDRLHDRGFRRRPARADAVRRRRARRPAEGRVLRPHRSARRSARRSRSRARRSARVATEHACSRARASPGSAAAWPCAAATPRSSPSALRHALTGTMARRARRHDSLRRALEQFDPRHRLARFARGWSRATASWRPRRCGACIAPIRGSSHWPRAWTA